MTTQAQIDALKATVVTLTTQVNALTPDVTVPPIVNPAIANFKATPSTIDVGQVVVLSADVANAVTLTLDGAPVTLPITLMPAVSHTYTLQATGASGTLPAVALAGVVVNAIVVPPPVGGFKSVSKIGTDQYAPSSGAAGSQPVQMQLHGYGGDGYSFGDSYSAIGDASLGYADNLPFYFHVQNTDNYLHKNPKIEIQPMDRVVKPGGGYMTSLFFGYSYGTAPKQAFDYTYRILDALYDWTLANYPQASRTRIGIYGTSMGAWACIHYGLRRPAKFACVFTTLPRWRLTSLSDLSLGTWIEQGSLPMSDGNGTYAQHNDMIAYVSNPANKLPFLSCATGRNDPYGLWPEHVEAIAALRATKRAFVYSWNNGNHSDGALSEAAIKATYNRESFELGKGYPVLMNSSLDSPLTDLVGGINLGFRWRNVIETVDGWSCEISNANGAVTVDVLPHSDVFTDTVAVKTITIQAGAWAFVSFFKAVAPPPPPVIPPPTNGLGEISSKPVNLAKTVLMQGFMGAPIGYDPGRYDRVQYTCILSGASGKFRVTTNDFVVGGASVPFGTAGTLTLMFDDKSVAMQSVAATDKAAEFTVDLTNIAEGWYRTTITGLDASWSILDYAVYVLKGAKAQPQSKMPVVTGSYTLKKDRTTVSGHHFAWVPSQCVPTIMPLVPRDCPAFSEIPKRQNVVLTQLVHGRTGDTYRPTLTKEGVLVTAGKQPYYFYDFQQAKPLMPLLDGPRGQGSLFCPTHVEVGKCAPTAKEGAALGPIDNTYFTDPWRVGKVREDGTVVTLAGWRHTTTPQYWNDPPTAELMGDWSAIPMSRRGFVELWGMAWRIPAIDYAAAPIATERGLKPHVTGVQMFVSDQRRVMPNGTGRIVKLQFSPTSHAAPPVVTEFHGDGWSQCFDVVSNGHQVHGQTPVSDADFRLWASDRMGHRIRVLGFDGTVLENWDGIPQPEGLALFERSDGLWLYYTSTVREGGKETGVVQNFYIRRRHTVTKEDVLIGDCNAKFPQLVGNNTLIGKIAISDGSFGPRGMIALATWANSNFSYPILIDGETGDLIDWLYPMQYSEPKVFGMGNPGMTYTSAVGIGNGRMVWGTACEGLIMASKALATDTVWPASVAAGEKEWHDDGCIEAFGHYGFGHYGLPLPWGMSANKDAFLSAHGHVRP